MDRARTEDVPPGVWVGFGDDRRYLLGEDAQATVWAWFRTPEGGWDHTLDPVHGTFWTLYGEAEQDEQASLARHIENIEAHGCGARGWCSRHPVHD